MKVAEARGNIPINIEATNATNACVEIIKETGGTITHYYRNPRLLKMYLHPHKIKKDWMIQKIPMPPPNQVMYME